jgi:hypothetical protein
MHPISYQAHLKLRADCTRLEPLLALTGTIWHFGRNWVFGVPGYLEHSHKAGPAARIEHNLGLSDRRPIEPTKLICPVEAKDTREGQSSQISGLHPVCAKRGDGPAPNC